MSQTTDTLQPSKQNSPPLVLHCDQVKNVYKGLKRGENCESELKACKSIADSLNNIIQDMNKSTQAAAAETDKINMQIAAKNQDLIKKEIEIQVLKDKNTPWWRHPITAAIAGFALGVYIAK